MGRHSAGLLAVAIIGASSGGVLPQEPTTATSQPTTREMVDNPVYGQWAMFKVGTTVNYKAITPVSKENNTLFEQSQTIKEVTPAKVVVEIANKPPVPGMNTPMNMDIPAKIAKDQLPENQPNYKELGKGDEEVKVGVKTYKCQWKEYEDTNQEGDLKFVSKCKIWTCNDVPGTLVKMTTDTTVSKFSGSMKSEMILVEFKIAE